MRLWITTVLVAGLAMAAHAQPYDCQHGPYTYHQDLPCDDPEGHVYQLKQQEQEQQAQEAAAQAARQWRTLPSDDAYMVTRAAERFLKRQMKDPGSFQVVTRHRAEQNSSGFRVTLTYRARNSFGGMNLESAQVLLDRNRRGLLVIPLE